MMLSSMPPVLPMRKQPGLDAAHRGRSDDGDAACCARPVSAAASGALGYALSDDGDGADLAVGA